MKSYVSERKASFSKGQSSANNFTVVSPQFKTGFQIPSLPYQKYGIITAPLWTTRNSVLRIVPGYDQNGVFPQNVNINTYDDKVAQQDFLSDTFVAADSVSSFGSINRPVLLGYPAGSPEDEAYGRDTVLRLFIGAIRSKVAGKSKARLNQIPEWKIWVDGNRGVGQALRFPTTNLMFQALVFQLNGRENQDLETGAPLVDENGNGLPLLCLCILEQKASISTFVDALVRPMDRRKPLNPATNNEFGPLAELDGNMLFLNTAQSQDGRNILRPSISSDGAGWDPIPYPLTEAQVHEYWQPWDKLLNFLTMEQQFDLCAKEFGADTVNHVFAHDNMCLKLGLTVPDHIAAAGQGRYETSSMVSMARPQTGARPTFAAPASPASAQPRPASTAFSMPEGNGVNSDALRERLNKIRMATSASQDKAALASDLLSDALPFGTEG